MSRKTWDIVLTEEATDDPPAPPPKIVVEPIVVVKVDEPLVSTETIAEVVMAEEALVVPV